MRNRKLNLETHGHLMFVTQKLTVEQLFNAGVRYFHVHVELLGNRTYVTNTLVGDPFGWYLSDLFRMMSMNRDELVILHIEKIFHNVDPVTFDRQLFVNLMKVANMYNISLYDSVMDGVDNLADVRFGQVVGRRRNLIVVYPRKVELFWLAEKSLDFVDPYLYSLTSIDDVINNRERGDAVVTVMKGAVTTNLTAHVEYYAGLGFVSLNEMFEMHGHLEDSQYPEFRIAEYLKDSTNLNDMVLSVNNADREIAMLIIKRNGKDFLKEL